MNSPQNRIARAASVSQSTVSRALRNDPALPPATCLRIQTLARRLGHDPNPLVSLVFANLRRRPGRPQLGTLAFLAADATQDAWRKPGTDRDFFLGARERAAQHGFAIEAHWAAEPGMSDPRLNAILRARGILGVILSMRDAERQIIELAWEHFALVRIGLSQRVFPLHCVVNHYYGTVRLVAKQLASRGYTRIGIALSRWQNDVTDQNWLAGFSTWQQFQPVRHRVPALLAADLSKDVFFAWFKRHKPDAVIAVDPDVVQWLHSANLAVPEKVGAALLDWHDHCGDVAGSAQNSRLVGSVAVDILLGQLRQNARGLPNHPQTTLIESTWHEGATVRQNPAR